VVIKLIEELGMMFVFFRELVHAFLGRKEKIRPLIIEQVAQVSYASLGIVLFTGIFVGAILIVQFHMILVKFDATAFTGGLSTSAILRQIGPLLISFLIAGKIGSFTTAELGTMKITEQIDAMKCLGVNPLCFLVLPRFIAIIIATSLLLFFALLIGILGSMLIAQFFYGINFLWFLESIPRFVGQWTLFGSFFQSLVYGFIIAITCTFFGINAKDGAKGVGIAVNKTAIYTAFFIVLANSATSFFLENVQVFIQNL
jgi:phospholipid/cholesterol/gamma-HCH transport system permease protein